MRKTYIDPNYEIDKFSNEDYITTSETTIPGGGTGENGSEGEINYSIV